MLLAATEPKGFQSPTAVLLDGLQLGMSFARRHQTSCFWLQLLRSMGILRIVSRYRRDIETTSSFKTCHCSFFSSRFAFNYDLLEVFSTTLRQPQDTKLLSCMVERKLWLEATSIVSKNTTKILDIHRRNKGKTQDQLQRNHQRHDLQGFICSRYRKVRKAQVLGLFLSQSAVQWASQIWKQSSTKCERCQIILQDPSGSFDHRESILNMHHCHCASSVRSLCISLCICSFCMFVVCFALFCAVWCCHLTLLGTSCVLMVYRMPS